MRFDSAQAVDTGGDLDRGIEFADSLALHEVVAFFLFFRLGHGQRQVQAGRYRAEQYFHALGEQDAFGVFAAFFARREHQGFLRGRQFAETGDFFNFVRGMFRQIHHSIMLSMRLRRVSGGLKKLDTLRSIGAQLQPLGLTTGYGEVLGNWCLKSIEEEQGAFLQGGIPRKQAFTLEFVAYGDDLQNR